MNKKIISAVLATSMLLTVSASNIYSISAFAEKDNKKTESKAEESDNCIVRFVLFVSDDFKNAQKDIQLTFKGNGEELTGTLGFSNDYSLNIALKKYVSYELTFSGDLGGYEILGADKYVYFEEDSTVNLTMIGADETVQQDNTATQEIAEGDLTEEQRIVQNYVDKLKELVDKNSGSEEQIALFTSNSSIALRNYIKESGDYYNTETWESLTDLEQSLYWILYFRPKDMFKDKFDLLQPEDIIKSDTVLSTAVNSGGLYKEFIELTTEELWKYQLEQTKVMGVVPDYFTVYMDMKTGKVNTPPVEQPPEESEAEETQTVTSIVTTTTAAQTEVTTTEKPENKEAKKVVKGFGESVTEILNKNKITIGMLIFALVGLVIVRIIKKKIKKSAYDTDDE